MRDIGKNIRNLRQWAGLTQEELAEKLFVTRQTVSNYETGRSRPDIEMLVRIAETLGTDPNSVLYGIPPEPRRREYILFAVGVAVTAILTVFCNYFLEFAAERRGMTYDQGWAFIGITLVRPAVFLAWGWTLAQALTLLTKVKPVSCNWGKIVVLAVIGLYLAVTAPAWTWYLHEMRDFPKISSQVLLFMAQYGKGIGAILAAMLGAALRLLGFAKKEA